MIQLILIIFLIKCVIPSDINCCKNDNIIIDKKCSDGSLIRSLSCPYKYLLNESNYELDVKNDNNNNLILHKAIVTPDKYCKSHLNNSVHNIYIICFDETDNEDGRLFYYGILLYISVLFIFITIAIYTQVTDLLDLQGICILHSISGLGIAFLLLGTTQLVNIQNSTICLLTVYIMYFCTMYAFFWLNTLSFHIWKSLVNFKILNFNKYWLLIYHIYSIGGSLILLLITMFAHYSTQLPEHLKPGFSKTKCWFETKKTEFIYLYCPMSIIIFLNIFYYIWTIIIIWKKLLKSDEKNLKIIKYRLKLCIKLFFIMGISWIFEILSAAFDDYNNGLKLMWTITDVINALQGFYIFLILVVFRKRVIRGLANRTFFGKRLPYHWKTAQDDECDEIEEEFGLSEMPHHQHHTNPLATI